MSPVNIALKAPLQFALVIRAAPLPGLRLRALGRIDLGSDADNIRLDSWRGWIVVGYGKGAHVQA
jgi:hypothetical protein